MDLLSADPVNALSTTEALIPAQAARARTNAAGAKGADGLWRSDGTARTGAKDAAATARSATVDADEKVRAGVGGGDADGTERTAAEPLTPAIAPARWQTLFLLVPVVHVPFGAIGTLFADLEPNQLGWLLADHAERLPARQARAVLGRISHDVFAGDTAAIGEPALASNSATTSGPLTTNSTLTANSTLTMSGALTTNSAVTADSAQRLAERTARYGTWLRSGRTGPTSPAEPAHSTGSTEPVKSTEGAGRIWVGTPLRVVRGLDRATIDLRNELAYDGLLISDRNERRRKTRAAAVSEIDRALPG